MKLIAQGSVNGDLGDDVYHLGHFFMDYMTSYPEDCVWQIDAATGETELKSSVKSRSIRLARCLRNSGLRPGDVAVVSGRNHLDVHIPFYAAYMNGLPLAGVDPSYKYEELKHHFETTKPKIVFCEVDNFVDMEAAVKELQLDTMIVTFGESDQSLAKFMKKYDDHASENTFQMQPKAEVWNLFAQTECVGPILLPCPNGPEGNVGRAVDAVQVQLVDPKTGEVIIEPHRKGELWSNGPRFAEYYNNPEATARAFTADGWYKTGDILYRDENGFYFFVDRMSSAFKFRRYYVMPMEVERVIYGHPDVLDLCVDGVPHPEDGKQATAVVMRRPGTTVTEQEIKDIVASKLSIHKHLNGGVIFVDNLPRTASGKIIRPKVLDVVLRNRTLTPQQCQNEGAS